MNNDGRFDWWGVVVELVDETFVKVRIFGTHNMIDRQRLPDTDLPNAQVLYPTTGGQSGSGSMGHNLQVDSWVYGIFMDGENAQYPLVIGVAQGTDYSMSAYNSGGGEFVGQSVTDASYVQDDGWFGGGTTGTDTGVNPNVTQNIPGGSNVEKVYNYVSQKLTQEGSSNDVHLHTSACVGVLQLESSASIDPNIVNSIGAYGICQWLGGRKSNLFSKYGRHPSLANQLDFMWWELNGGGGEPTYPKKRWLQATNLSDSVAGFCCFERAEEFHNGNINRNHPNFKRRYNYAQGIYNTLKPSTKAPVTTPGQSVIERSPTSTTPTPGNTLAGGTFSSPGTPDLVLAPLTPLQGTL